MPSPTCAELRGIWVTLPAATIVAGSIAITGTTSSAAGNDRLVRASSIWTS
jgi:hypothetical protein